MPNHYQPLKLKDFITLLIRKWVALIVLPLLLAVLAAGGTLLMDNEYKSTANLLPAQQRSFGIEALLGGRVGGLASSIIGGGSRTTFDRYLVLLYSETTQRKVVEKFNLIDVYELRGHKFEMIEARKQLNNNTAFKARPEGNFTIEVWDKDPERARDMALYYIDILNAFNIDINTREARAYREFVEQRYMQAFADVDSLRGRLAEFQRNYGIFELPEQVKAYYSILGDVTAEKVRAEIALDLAERTVGKNSQIYQQAAQQLAVITRRLEQAYESANKDPILLNLSELPDIGIQYFELLQNIELQTEILKFIVPMYEQAALEEAKSLPMVSVVDEPRIAEKKDKPFRALIVITVLMSSFLVMLITVVLQRVIELNREFFGQFFVSET